MSEVSSKNHKFLYAPELNVRLLDSHVSTRPTYTHTYTTHIHTYTYNTYTTHTYTDLKMQWLPSEKG